MDDTTNTHALTRMVNMTELLPPDAVADQLSYQRMLLLADTYLRWAVDEQTTPEQAAKLLEWARGMKRLARLKGKDWNPPEPEKISLVGFLARQLEESCG